MKTTFKKRENKSKTEWGERGTKEYLQVKEKLKAESAGKQEGPWVGERRDRKGRTQKGTGRKEQEGVGRIQKKRRAGGGRDTAGPENREGSPERRGQDREKG